MSENTKKLLSLLMVAAMLFSMMLMSVSAQGQTATEQTTEPAPMPLTETVPEMEQQAEPNMIPLELGIIQGVTIIDGAQYAYLSFAPTESGEYTFTSISELDTCGELYDMSGEEMVEIARDDDSGEGNNFLIICQLTAGNTYQLRVRQFSMEDCSFQVEVSRPLLQSIRFTPISVVEGTSGSFSSAYNPETDAYDLEYYYYEPYNLVQKSTYTATLTDGTVLTGTGSSFTYDGVEYGFSVSTDQGYYTQWTVGNTYSMTVSVLGKTADVAVTITESPLQSIAFTPISVVEGTAGFLTSDYNPETDAYDLEYFIYEAQRLIQKSTYTATFTDDTVLTGTGDGFTYNDEWYNFDPETDQNYENQWTVGGDYYVEVTVMGQKLQVPVTITTLPLESLTFTPIEIVAGEVGSTVIEDGVEYLRYNEEMLLQRSTFTATFADGTWTSGCDRGFYYNDEWYSFDYTSNQSAENPWLAGGTYYIDVTVGDITTQIPVAISASPLQSITFNPITVIENSCGIVESVWNPETESSDTYFYYQLWDVMSTTNYTAIFADGTVHGGSGNSSLYYNGEWYQFELNALQSYENQWTVDNTYYISVSVMGKTVEVPVTIVPSPVVSFTVEPVTIIEGKNCWENIYWTDDGTEQTYLSYSWGSKLSYTVVFEDGTSISQSNGNGFFYGGKWYSINSSDSQGYENQWTAGNTYTATASVMGVSAEVSVTINESPIASVAFDPIPIEEHTNGYWTWQNGTEYFSYDWLEMISYTVTFKDGTTKGGNYYSGVEYDGEYYSIAEASDLQQVEHWLKGNTYTATVRFERNDYPAYVTIYRATEDNGFEYMVQDGKAIITGCTTTGEILSIPETIDGYPVVGISSLGDAAKYALEIRIPDGITMLSANFLRIDTDYSYVLPLKKLTLGSGISAISIEMLQNTFNLEWIEVSANNPYFSSVDGVVYDKAVTTLIFYPPAKKELHVVPDSVTDVSILGSVWPGVFSNANIQLGAGVTDYKIVDGIIYNADMTTILVCTAAATGSYVMPDTVTEIGSFAFANSNLTNVTISPNVTYIAYDAFCYSEQLKEIAIPESVTHIEPGAFTGCERLEKVHIADLASWCEIYFADQQANPLYYAHDLYLNGEKIVDLEIPEDVVSRVYRNVFAGGSFESVTIPDSVKEISEGAFGDCQNLKRVDITDLAAWCTTYFGDAQANPLCYARDLYLNGEKIVDLVIPESITDRVYLTGAVKVNNYTFCNASIESVSLPANLQMIGEGAFAGSDIKTLELPESVESLGYAAFSDCRDLESVTFNNTMDLIPSECFYGTGLQSVKIPAQMRYIEPYAFADSALTEVIFESESVIVFANAFKNCALGDLDLTDSNVCTTTNNFINIQASQIWLPKTATEISYRCYAFNENLVAVTIPDTVTTIDWDAFDGDDNLSHVLYTGTQEQWDAVDCYSPQINQAMLHCEAVGNEITSIEHTCTTIRFFCSICNDWQTVAKANASHSFQDGVCTVCQREGVWDYVVNGETDTLSITGYMGDEADIVIPSVIDGMTVTEITYNAFAGNTELNAIEIPGTITEICYGAFDGCIALREVVVEEGVTAIGDSAFNRCWSLQELSLPDTVTHIGSYAFRGCGALTDLVLPEALQSIGTNAFLGCGSLTSITIPASVKEIQYGAFELCETLKTVVFMGDAPEMQYALEGKMTAFYPANAEGWEEFLASYEGNVTWYASGAPEILTQPEETIVESGSTATVSAEAHGHRLSYQWYYAPYGADTFDAVGGNSTELSIVMDEDNPKGQAFCVVSDILGNQTFTDTVMLVIGTEPKEIRVAQMPYTVEYSMRQAFRTDGLEVAMVYYNQTEKPIEGYEISGYDPNVSGEQEITVTYGEFVTGFCVTVNEEKLNFTNEEQRIEVNAPKDAIDSDTVLVAEPVEIEETVQQQAPEIFKDNAVVSFDITLQKDEEIIQPQEEVKVSIPVPETMQGARCRIYHVDDNGVVSDMDAQLVGSYLEFYTTHFSVYAIVELPGYTVSGNLATAAQGQSVIVKLLRDGIVQQTQRTADGTYCFEDVTDGIYTLEACVAGSSNVRKAAVEISGANAVVDLSVVEYTVTFVDWDGTVISSEKYLEGSAVSVPANPTRESDDTYSYTFAGWDKKVVACTGDVTYTATYTATNTYIGVEYEVVGETVTITGFDTAFSGEFVIPSTIEGKPVTAIGEEAFYDCYKLTGITIPEGVTSIGKSAFYNCDSLVGITIPVGVTEIGETAFYHCDSLESIAIPGSVEAIGKWAFDRCVSLKEVALSEGLVSIGYYAFRSCSSLASIVIPDSVETIGYAAFQGCSALESVALPAGLTSISYYAFAGCSSLTSIVIPEGVKSIGQYAFSGCENLETITIPESVTHIRQDAFDGCTGLKTVVYAGTEEQWNGIQIGEGNEILFEATMN